MSFKFDPFWICILKRRELPGDWIDFAQCLDVVNAAAIHVAQSGDARRLNLWITGVEAVPVSEHSGLARVRDLQRREASAMPDHLGFELLPTNVPTIAGRILADMDGRVKSTGR